SVWIGQGAPGVCAVDATGLLPPGVAFAICEGDGEATPVRWPSGGVAFGEDEAAGELCAGEVAGDLPGAVAGELAFEGGGLETAAPCAASDCAPGDARVEGEVTGAGEVADGPGEAAGLAAPPGAGLSCCAGARAPMFARSCPIRIFPRNTGRSKV